MKNADESMQPRKDIRGVILKEDGNLDFSHVYALKTTSDTYLLHKETNAPSDVLSIGSILKVELNKEKVRMVIVRLWNAKSPSTIQRVIQKGHPIIAFVGEHIFNPQLVDNFNQFMRKKHWNEFTPRPIMVVKGYHYGKKADGREFIDTMKGYNFKVTADTRTPHSLKRFHVATVMTQQGEQNIVIDSISYARGSIARKMAYQLRPVIKVYHHGMRNGRLTRLYNLNIVQANKKRA